MRSSPFKFIIAAFLTLALLQIAPRAQTQPIKGSEYIYITNVDSTKASQLEAKGGHLLRMLYGNQAISPTERDAFSLFVTGSGKKTLLSSPNKIDLSIAGKKSQGTEQEKEMRRNKFAQVLAMIWKIYGLGVKQGEDARSASYKVIDRDDKLYHFLKEYATIASAQAPSFAYDRDPRKNKSSHYKTESPESQWGVDMRFFANQASLKLLPHDKSHLLFGKLVLEPQGLQPNLLFIKFEDYGIAAPSEIAMHGINYLKYQLRTQSEKLASRTEGFIRPEIVQQYLEIIEKLSPDERKTFKTDDAGSVRGIILTVDNIVNARPDLKPLQAKLTNLLKTLYPHDGDNIKYRSGNEIIIDLQKI